MAVERLQHGGDATRILGTDPVQLEAVGHIDGDLGKIFCNECRQRLDPGVELLLWQLLTQLLNADLPQGLACIIGWFLCHCQKSNCG
ncbi:hypothetical protein SDC9_144792 [bioreactor metagenome]|uniref:Uncharacterized protein n=1 Tax=bioreactor metagenome TaxID=1076179 RepID=A0A645E733_9ZZZZ